LGSRWVKVVLACENRICLKDKFDTIEFYRKYSNRKEGRLSISLSRLEKHFQVISEEFVPGGILKVRTTGYGRHLARYDFSETVPELQAHVHGACYQLGIENFTLLDIGGQDTKVILVRHGRIEDFFMNDRCAAGSGRYLENMARLLGVNIQEIGRYYRDPVSLSATCATFGESEVIGKIVEGCPLERICAGINYTVFQRVLPDLQKMPSEILVLTGGCAYNQAICHFLKKHTGFQQVLVPSDPQFNGAIGALYL